MPSSPIISIFRSSGGQAVARGVLIAGTGDSVIGAAGLFSPWPESLTEGAEFSIYVPGSDGQPEECLQPKQLGILDLSREEHATYGVVSFVEEPTNVSFQPATTQQHHQSQASGWRQWSLKEPRNSNNCANSIRPVRSRNSHRRPRKWEGR